MLSDQPRRTCVSVVIPTFNRAHLIREALDSVFAQTFRDYEILVVDDGSEDDTESALADVQTRITYCKIPHLGASAARNAGLEMARGEYIAFLDSDDLWQVRFLERMIVALEKAPGAGFVYCDYSTCDERGMATRACLPPDHKIHGNSFAKLLESDFISTGAVLVRRRCLEQIGGFDPHLKIVHDWDLWLRLAWRFDAAYVDEPLLHIRIHSQALSRNGVVICMENLLVLAKLRRDMPDAARRYRSVLRRQMAGNHRALAGHLVRMRRPLSALKHLVLMLSARFL